MRNLLGRLLDRSPQSLAGIARSWEIEPRGPDLHHDVSLLYRTLTDPWNVALAWEGLSPVEQNVLRIFADGVARDNDTLARECGLNPDDLLSALRKLYKAGYIYHNAPPDDDSQLAVELFMPPELASMIAQVNREQSAGDLTGEPVPVLLDRLDEARLIELARELGYSFIPAVSQRAELAGYIETRLTDPDYVTSAVGALDPLSARLWPWLISHLLPPGTVDAQTSLQISPTELRSAIHALARRGLIWRGYGSAGGERRLQLVVPDAIRHPRRPVPPPPPELEAVDATQVDTSEWLHPYAAAWDLLTLLRERKTTSAMYLDQDGVRRATGERLGSARLWQGISGTPPSGYLAFLGYLAAGLGLVADHNTMVPIGELLSPWTRLGFDEQTHRMIDLWRNGAEWFEGSTLESFQAWGADWPALRRSLISALTELEGDRWYTVDSVVQRFAASHPTALGAHVTVAAANEQFEQTAKSRQQGVIRRAAEITLTTAGAWLGLVELAGSLKEARLIRITRLGSLVANGSKPDEERTAGNGAPISVQPNFEILLLSPSPRRIWALSAFADLVHLDRVSIYRLSEQSVVRSMDAGVSVRNVVRFLEQQGGGPLPQNIAYALSDWERRHRMVGIRESVLLDLDCEPVPGEIERILRENGIAAERLPGDRLLIQVSETANVTTFVERIARMLREAGHIPRLSRNR